MEEQVGDLQTRVESLAEQGVSLRDIAEELGVTVYRVRVMLGRSVGRAVGQPRGAEPVETPAEVHPTPSVAEKVMSDVKLRNLAAGKSESDAKYRHVLDEYLRLREEMAALTKIRDDRQAFRIDRECGDAQHEATAIIVGSDWHLEEQVNPDVVNGLNEFDLEIAEKRVGNFFAHSIKLLKMFQRDVVIRKGVLAILGDLISGYIHDELLEINQLAPVDAAIFAQRLLVAGIEQLLEQTNLREILVIGKSGNHARLTQKTRHATEQGNSLEHFIYTNVADRFRNEKRLKFDLSPSYHTYVPIYDHQIRFHHGHDIRFQGGVGGLYIPTNKAIGQWNKAKWASLDIFGHWHQFKSDRSFISNGSLIGFNPYAVSIKADYERPQQSFLLWDRDWQKTIVAPVIV